MGRTASGWSVSTTPIRWRGEQRIAPDEPKVWFTSTESFAKVLSAGNDNTVRYPNRVLQIPADSPRRHYVKCKVRVHQACDGALAVFHGRAASPGTTPMARPSKPTEWLPRNPAKRKPPEGGGCGDDEESSLTRG